MQVITPSPHALTYQVQRAGMSTISAGQAVGVLVRRACAVDDRLDFDRGGFLAPPFCHQKGGRELTRGEANHPITHNGASISHLLTHASPLEKARTARFAHLAR
jgi:hypothetical protein